MRRSSCSASVLILFLTLLLSASGYVRMDELVLWYTFDEVQGQVVIDDSGNGLDATVHDNPESLDSPNGMALKFDGDKDKLSLAYADALNLPSYTVSIWMNTEKASAAYTGVFGRSGRQNCFWIHNGQTDSWGVHHRYRDGSNNNHGPPNAGASAHGEWVLVTLTKDANGSATYVDGQRVATGTVSHEYMSNRSTLYLGANPDNGNGQWYKGQLDDVRLYKVAMSDAEVMQLYNGGKGDFSEAPQITLEGEGFVRVALGGEYTETGATASDAEDGDLTDSIVTTYNAPASVDPRGPMARWSFNGDAKDVSGNANDATLVGDTAFVEAKFGQGIEMDNEGDYAEVVTISGAANTSTLSVSAWIKIKSFGTGALGDGGIFTTSISINPVLLWVNYDAAGDDNPSLSFNVGDAGAGSNRANGPAEVLKIDQWHHVVGVLDGATRKIYVDGEMKAEVTDGSTEPANLEGLSFRIGSWSNTADFDFDGVIDEVQLYDLALTEEEITALHTWDGEEVGPPTTIDSSKLGDRTVKYAVTDSFGITATAERQVRIFDPAAPVITLNGEAVVRHELASEYSDLGATVADADGNVLDAQLIKLTGVVDGGAAGTYTLAYDFTDTEGRPAETVFRTVQVSDTTPPVLTIHGGSSILHPIGQPYLDLGAMALDAADGSFSATSDLYEWNTLTHKGFLGNWDESVVDLDGNGGLILERPAGEGKLTGTLYFGNDADFRSANVGIDQNDNFRNLFEGVFHARVEGDYRFGLEWPDDRGSFWLDLDRDGVFESEGELGSEWMNAGNRYGYRTVSLQPGIYKVAIAHMEGGGGSRIHARWMAPAGGGPTGLSDLDPGAENQNLTWGIAQGFDVNTPGVYEVTYTATDAAGNTTTAKRTVTVGEVEDPPVITLNGRAVLKHAIGSEYVDEGASVAAADGTELDSAGLLVTGIVDHAVAGSYVLTYNYVDLLGRPAETKQRIVVVGDMVAPVITPEGEETIEHIAGQEFVDPGLKIEDNIDQELIWGSTAGIPDQGLILHIDASSLLGLEDGDPVVQWSDLSPAGNNLSDVRGDPSFAANAINQRPAVYFDGDDYMAITQDIGRAYSIFVVARHDLTQRGRLISSRNQNWFIGWWGSNEDIFHPGGWATEIQKSTTTDPRLLTALSSGSNQVSFYADGVDKTTISERNAIIGKFQLGGWQATSERSSGYVSEVLIYDSQISTAERISVETYLASKYRLLDHPEHSLPELNVPGEYTILYTTADSSNNRSFATRKLIVKPDPTLPVIVLEGDAVLSHQAGTEFIDPGAKVIDGNGEPVDGAQIVVSGSVDSSKLGIFSLTYDYTNAEGQTALQVERTVVVADTAGPVITLEGESIITIKVGAEFSEPGAKAVDAFEGEVAYTFIHEIPQTDWVPGLLAGGLGGNINVTQRNPGNLGVDPLGPSHTESKSKPPWADNYTIVYSGQVFDEDGKVSFMGDMDDNFWLKINDQVVVQGRGWNNSRSVQLDLGEGDLGWHDFELRVSNGNGGAGRARQQGFGIDKSGEAPSKQNVDNTLFEIAKNTDANTMDLFRVMGSDYTRYDTSKAGSYLITYTAEDSLGQIGTTQRTLIIREDLSKPLISLNGAYEVTVEADPEADFEDPGAVATSVDGTVLKENIQGEGSIDLSKPGSYTLTYDYADADGNYTDPAVRTVLVVDTLPPEIILEGGDFINLLVGQPYEDPGFKGVDRLDGEVVVLSSEKSVPGRLHHYVYFQTPFNEDFVNLESDIGIHNDQPLGTHYLGAGPRGEGLFFAGDAEFRSHPHLNQNDNFQNLFTGYFNAPRDGDYTFMIENTDDRAAFWMDRDADGSFSRTGLMGDERIIYGNQRNTIFLGKGSHYISLAHSEWGGNSSLKASFALPDGSIETINPAAQPNLWSTTPEGTIDTGIEGQHVITYFAVDKAGNWSSVQRIIEVKPDRQRPVIILLGESELIHEAGSDYQDAGVLIEDFQGQPIEENAVVAGLPDGMTLGEYTITYDYSDAEGHVALQVNRKVLVTDTQPPVISFSGSDPSSAVLGQAYSDAGATAKDARDGDVRVYSINDFPKEGLVLHLDAASFKDQLSNGDVISTDWEDLSGYGNHGDNQKGDPTWVESGPNGRPTVNFDGDDLIWTSKNFESELTNYSILTVARYTGGDNERVISSRGRNWMFGFHGNSIRRFHSDGWLHHGGGSDTLWHLHAGDASNMDQANFWLDGEQLVNNGSGLQDARYKPRNINLGGYNDNNELSKCEISEVILYNRILSPIEYVLLTTHLNSKYGLNGGGSFVMETVDTSTTGERTVGYMSFDSSGNISTASRKVLVVEPATLPVITLNGEASVEHDSGTPYEDAGATVADSAGNALDASQLVVSSNVNVSIPGSYAVAYDYTAADGTKAPTKVRVITVLDKTAPVITLVGGETYEHTLGNLWVEPGVSALDNADGQVEVENSLLRKNFFLRRGYLIDPSVDSLIDLSNGGGLLSQEAINEVTYIYGPRGDGIHLNGDGDFMDHNPPDPYDVGIDRNDKYQNLFLAYFHCNLDRGRYEFGVEWPDDRASVWLDLDQDGIFELEGDRGTELMNGPTYQRGFMEVSLDKGFYKYAVAHREGGGGSRVDARFRAIVGPGPTTLVRPNPGDPKQDGLWVQYQPIDVFTEGEYEITYSAKDSSGNTSEIKRKVIVKTNPDAPIIYLKGEESITLNYGDAFEDPGSFVEDLDGNTVEGDLLVSGDVDTQRMGLYRVRYDFTSAEGLAARTVVREVTVVDAEAPVITLVGEANETVIQGHEYIDPGAGAVDNYDGELPVIQAGRSLDGLIVHLDASSIRGVGSGDTVEIWNDLSGNENDAKRNIGAPYLDADVINGMPAVYFNGNSQIDAPPYIGSSYSVVAVVQADGIHNGRLLATVDDNKNWIMGYHGGYEDVFHPGTWRTNRTILVTKKPRLYTATSTGANEVHFYADGVELTTATNANLDIGRLQMGAWASLRERASGHVAEVFIYNRPLNHSERLSLEAQMNAKYSLNGYENARVPVNTEILGSYDVVYSATDSSGNLAVVRRTVEVVPDPDAPVISLFGEPKIVHEAGNPFEDPGVSLTAGEQLLDASLVKVDGSVDVKTPGDYTLTYNYRPYKKTHAIDVIRIVSVVDTQPPVITLVGESVIRLAVGASYDEPGFNALDASDGETFAYSHLDKTPHILDVNGYMIDGRDNQQVNFNQGGGLISAQPVGVGTFAGDITGINGDGAFRAIIPEITRNDDYQFLFHGEFYAIEDASYEFGIDNADNVCSFWIDLDQDGEFESDGDLGTELVFTNFNGGGWKTYALTTGFYKVAIGFMEHGGGAWVRPRVRLPGGPRLAIHPSNPNQVGHWFAGPSSSVDVNTPGTYLVTYSSSDSSGNVSTVEREIVVVEDTSTPYIVIKGDGTLEHEVGSEFSDPGAKVLSGAGDVLIEDLKSNDAIDSSVLGESMLNYSHDGAEDVKRTVVVIDTTAPSIALNEHANGGTDEVKVTVGQELADPGLTLTDAGDSAPYWTTDREYTPNQLELFGFSITPSNDALLDFSDNGGLLQEVPNGRTFFRDGPGDRGLDFKSDPDFQNARVGISHWDNYQIYITGYFLARVDGAYEFRTDRADDRATFWIDLDKDGILKRNGGTAGDERISWGNGGRIVDLKVGFYKVLIAHREGGGGSSIQASFKTPVGAGPTEFTVIKPTDPAQGGLWYTDGLGPIDMTQPGEHLITYYASDASGNLSTAKRKVIIEIDPSAPVLTLVGDAEMDHEAGSEFIDPGANVADTAGNELDKSKITVSATLDGAVVDGGLDANLTGTYELLYEFVDDAGKTAIPLKRTVVVQDTLPPVINLLGQNPARVTPGSSYLDAGATGLDQLDGEVTLTLVSSKPTHEFVPGLLAGMLAGNNTNSSRNDPNNGTLGVDPLGPTVSEINTVPPWGLNTTIVYTGQIYDKDGKISFTENIDDGTLLIVDGKTLIDDGGWNTRVDADFESANGEGGWFDFEVRFRNGGGGGGVAEAPGFGFDPEGAKDWSLPRNSDPETADVFRYELALHNTIDTTREGEYYITYTATDAAGNTSQVVRTIIVKDDLTLPVITLVGEPEQNHEAGATFEDPFVTVADRKGNPLDASKVTVTGEVDASKLGTYTLAYDFTNDKGRSAPTVQRKVIVVDTTAPSITLVGGTPYKLSIGDTFTDPGSTVTDNLDTGLVADVKLEGALEGLVAHWTFDDAQGATAAESINGLNGTLTGFDDPEAAWVAGKSGTAMKFEGTGGHIVIPSSEKLNLQTLTVSAWINASNYAQDGFIFEKTVGGSINTHFSLYLQGSDELNFRIVQGGNLNDTNIPSSLNFKADEWNHIAVTYDGAIKSVYVDEALVTAMPAFLDLSGNGDGQSVIGAMGSGTDYFFNGLIDDVRVYDRAIDEADIPKLNQPSGIDTSKASVRPYVLAYTASDSSGNTTTVKREVIITNDAVAPVLTLLGDAEVTLNVGDTYEDAGATASDNKDGNLTPFIDDGGSIDEVDTSKAGEYIVTYDVSDFSGNAATQVTRKVIVLESNPFTDWISNGPLKDLAPEQRTMDADPDADEIPNLLEYVFGGNPTVADRTNILPEIKTTGRRLSLTFIRLKATKDPSVVIKPMLTNNLGDPDSWDESAVSVQGVLQGVTQDDLPDGKPWATSDYERVKAISTTNMAAEPSGKQFIRIVVEKE